MVVADAISKVYTPFSAVSYWFKSCRFLIDILRTFEKEPCDLGHIKISDCGTTLQDSTHNQKISHQTLFLTSSIYRNLLIAVNIKCYFFNDVTPDSIIFIFIGTFVWRVS